MASVVPSIRLASGALMPQLGFGTWMVATDVAERVIKDAIDVGYRHFDLAWAYQNQKEIGAALKECIDVGKVKRSDLFLTSKVWNTAHSTERASAQIDEILGDLQTDYLDLMLIHFPMGWKEGPELAPMEEGKLVTTDIDYMDTWRALEAAVDAGKLRNIGLANFNSKQIARVIAAGRIKPANLQVETHLYYQQHKLREVCENNGLSFTGWSSLGNPGFLDATSSDKPRMLENPVVKEVAAKCGKTPAQIALRWSIQRGIIVIPKSNTKSRIEENFDVVKFKISIGDMAKLDQLDSGSRILGGMPGIEDHKYYPFNED